MQHTDRENDPQYNAPRLALALSDFLLLRRLGDGSYSTVVLAEHRQTGHQYALKIVEKQLVLRHRVAHHVQRERRILDALNGQRGIVGLHFTFQDEQHVYFGLQPCLNGELYDQIRGNSNTQGTMPLAHIRIYTAQIVCMLQCLRTAGIVHRDIKPENLLLDNDGNLVLVDFGTARWVWGDGSTQPPAVVGAAAPTGVGHVETTNDAEEKHTGKHPQNDSPPTKTSFVGTAEYVAPETLAGDAPGYAMDLWGLGCVLYQMLVGKPPFKGPTEYATFALISEGTYALPDDVDADATELVRQLLQVKPDTRLGAADLGLLRAHRFFQHVDWQHGVWTGVPFVAPVALTPTDEASDWELLSLQALAEALPMPRYEFEVNPAFAGGGARSSEEGENNSDDC